jgi:hypothetical protein
LPGRADHELDVTPARLVRVGAEMGKYLVHPQVVRCVNEPGGGGEARPVGVVR